MDIAVTCNKSLAGSNILFGIRAVSPQLKNNSIGITHCFYSAAACGLLVQGQIVLDMCDIM